MKDKLYKNADIIKISRIYVSYADSNGLVNDTDKNNVFILISSIKDRLGKGESFDDIFKMKASEVSIKLVSEVHVLGNVSARKDLIVNPILKDIASKQVVGAVSEVFDGDRSFNITKCNSKVSEGYKPFSEIKDSVALKNS